jgi:hypothetical protein
MRLYEIQEKFVGLLERYNSDITEEEREAVRVELDALQCSKDEKLEACCGWYRNLEAERDLVAGEIERLKGLLGRAEGQLENWKAYLERCLGVGEKWKKGPFSLGWRKSEAVKIVDATLIPTQYMREYLEYRPAKDEIKKDLACGATIPGCELEVRHNLQIK